MSRFFSFLTLSMTMFIGSACWRMPTDDDYSVIPATNHPDNTGDTNATPGMPTLNY